MQLAIPPHASGPVAHPDHEAGFAATVDEATLDLLHGCIEAMSLLQAKFAGLEIEAQIKLDASAREIGELHAALTDEMRRGEVCAAQLARLEADNANWRLRAETDALSLARLNDRVARLEGMGAVAGSAESAATSAAPLPGMALEAETPGFPELRARLSDVDANIADQRARITSLQRKLAAVTREASERSAAAAAADGAAVPPAPAEHDILDLREVSRSLTSAA